MGEAHHPIAWKLEGQLLRRREIAYPQGAIEGFGDG
jgi:hypothetical protein